MEPEVTVSGWEAKALNTLHTLTGVEWDSQKVAGTFYTKIAFPEEASRQVVNTLRSFEMKASCVPGPESSTSYVRVSSSTIQKAGGYTSFAFPCIAQLVREDIKIKFNSLNQRNGEIEGWIKEHEGYSFDAVNRFDPDSRGTRCPKLTELTYSKTICYEDEDGATHTETMQVPFCCHANSVVLNGMRVICSQAPRDDTEGEFWQAVKAKSSMILDLTNKTDREKKEVQRYFPPEINDVCAYDVGDIRVTCIAEERDIAGDKRLKRHYYVVQEGAELSGKMVSRLHFRGWPDSGAVSVEDLSMIVHYIRSQKLVNEVELLWMHCRAGVGRTGTVTVALVLAQMREEGTLTLENYAEVIDELIIEGRKQRDILFVQDVSQYQLLHDFAKNLF
ncbi:MAG: hypothetical protein JSR46_08215 [Verrucomicrobia bacterium]|nr:hypothetical protein [Verrucomicrobiota bacterium]